MPEENIENKNISGERMGSNKKYYHLLMFLILGLLFNTNSYALETLGGLPAVNVEANPQEELRIHFHFRYYY